MPKKLITLKIDEADHEAWKAKAVAAGLGLSAWIRERCEVKDVPVVSVRESPVKNVSRSERARPAERSTRALGCKHGAAWGLCKHGCREEK